MFFGVAFALLVSACAAGSRPADAGRPRADDQPYPVILAASEERRGQALASWKSLAVELAAAGAPTPELQPVTATVRAMPANLIVPLQLQKAIITDPNGKTRDATRESLRRFLEIAAPLLGVELREVSLVEIADRPDGTKCALYQQNPFDLPLRNNFGVIKIVFTPNLRVVGLTSTTIPDTERLRLVAARLTIPPTPEKALASLVGRTVRFNNAAGHEQSRAVASANELNARELIVFPVSRGGDAPALELHLAWEIAIAGGEGGPLLAYVDAVTGEQLADDSTTE